MYKIEVLGQKFAGHLCRKVGNRFLPIEYSDIASARHHAIDVWKNREEDGIDEVNIVFPVENGDFECLESCNITEEASNG